MYTYVHTRKSYLSLTKTFDTNMPLLTNQLSRKGINLFINQGSYK